MKKLLFLATIALASASFAAVTSQAVFTLVTDNAEVSDWNYTVGIATDGTDAYDSGLDANEPPWSPGKEVRMHSLAVPGSASGLLMDYRDGTTTIDIGGYWAAAAGVATVRDEIWGLGAIDFGAPDLVTVDGNNLGTIGSTTGTMSWDLSGAAGWSYYLYVLDDDVEIDMQVTSSYDYIVANRSGLGPTCIITAIAGEPIPEPGTIMLLGSGLLALVGLSRRR